MVENTLLQKIHSLQKLTRSEVKIADFFAQNEADLVFENVSTISTKTGVSKATVVRFVAKLGYKKFNELIQELRDELVFKEDSLPIRYTLKRKQLVGREDDIIGENFSCIMKNLQKTHDLIEPEKFLEIAQVLMKQDAHLYITGQRTSYCLASLFHLLISRIRPNCTLLGAEISVIPDRLVNVGAKDVLLAIFRHPYGNLTRKIARYCAEQGATVIVITDSEFNPAYKFATEQIIVPSDGLSIFNSFAAFTALLESLNIAALKFSTEEGVAQITSAESVIGDFGVFCSSEDLDLSEIQGLENPEK